MDVKRKIIFGGAHVAGKRRRTKRPNQFIVAEECAGLATGTTAFEEVCSELCPGATIKAAYASEKDPVLNKFLKSTDTFSKVVLEAGEGASAKADKALGTDGKVNIYIAGCECQPFSRMGNNQGKLDERSKTTRAAIQFICRRKPEVFILEQVANIKSKAHKDFLKKHIIKKLRGITHSKCNKRLYKMKAAVLNGIDFGVPALRKRYYLVGTRKDSRWKNFKMPKKGVRAPKTLKQLLPPVVADVPDENLTYTEMRNWAKIKEHLLIHRKTVHFPVIGDFHQSKRYGMSLQERRSPCITRSRALAKAFFIINKDLKKRRLTVRDFATLQGWSARLQRKHLGIGSSHSVLPENKLLSALGNGFSCHVVEAIFKQLLLGRI